MKIHLKASTIQAIKILKYIGEHQNETLEGLVSCKDAAAAIHVTPSYFMQVVRVLMREGIVRSTRGRTGGFKLTRTLQEITLFEIVDLMENDEHQGKSLTEGLHELGQILDSVSESIEIQLQAFAIADV